MQVLQRCLIAVVSIIAVLQSLPTGATAAASVTSPPCSTDREEVHFSFQCLQSCEQDTWEILEENSSGDEVVVHGGNYSDLSNITVRYCLLRRTYKLRLRDSAGDGWDPGTFFSLEGNLQPKINNVSVLRTAGGDSSFTRPFSVLPSNPLRNVPASLNSSENTLAGQSLSQPGCPVCATGLSRSPGLACGCAFPMVATLQLTPIDLSFATNSRLQRIFINETARQLNMTPSQVRLLSNHSGIKLTTVTFELLPLTAGALSVTEVQAIDDRLYGRRGQSLLSYTAAEVSSYNVVSIQYPPGTGPRSEETGATMSTAGLIGIIAAITVAVLVVLGILFCLVRRKSKDQGNPSLLGRPSNKITSQGEMVPATETRSTHEWKQAAAKAIEDRNRTTSEVYTYKDLYLATNGFSKANLIGEGGFGRVYRAIMPTGAVAAVKQLDPNGRQGEREFRVEVSLLSRLHHPHLVELVGYCADSEQRLLAYEFMPNGSLQDHLHGTPTRKGVPLDWATRMRVAVGSARGLQYLHDVADPRVIHRDFKSSNILLNHDFVAKVADFGLAKLAPDRSEEQISTRVLGTFGYVAPEYVMSGHLTEKSDVYSFGVVLLELITGRRPVDVTQPPGQQSLVAWAGPYLTNREKLVRMVDPVLQGQYPLKSLYHLAAVAAMCVQSEPDYRPLMADVVESLVPLLQTNASELRFEMPPIKVKDPEQSAATDIRSQQQRDGSNILCLNCGTGPRDMMVQPCWHVVCCLPCAARMAASQLPCPICRRVIFGAQKAPRSTPGDPSSGSGYMANASHLEM